MAYTPIQDKVIRDRGGNMLVSASAGSGKTTVMIERIMLLLEQKYSLERMVVCTFTRAAAADMRAKLQNKLIQKSESGARYADEQLLLLPSCQISTIHSFCQSLISTYFYEVGVDPTADIADEVEAEAMLSGAINEVITAAIESGDERYDLLRNVVCTKHGDDNLVALVRKVYHYAVAQAHPDQFFACDEVTDERLAIAQSVVDARRDYVQKTFPPRVSDLLSDCAAIGYEKGREKCEQLLEAISTCACVDKLKGSVKDEYKNLRARLSRLIDDYHGSIKAVNEYDLAPTGGEHGLEKVLLTLTADVKKAYDREKQRKAVMDYADLEHYACKLVENEQVRSEIAASYDFIFVDEYQDVNPLQERIIEGVKSAGNLFLVGDVKQSIYAFRMCNPKFFLDKYNNFDRYGFLPPYELNANFRSRREILQLTNEVFRPLMTVDFGGVDYEGKAQLVCGNELEGKDFSGGTVNFHVTVKPKIEDVTSGVYSVLAASKHTRNELDVTTDAIVADIVAKLDDKSANIRMDDIAILSSTRNETVGLVYEKLKKLGVSVAITDEMKYSSVYEVSVLCSFMRLLTSFVDDIALVAVLRSGLVGLTDDQLAAIKLNATQGDNRFYVAVQKYFDEHDDEITFKLARFYAMRDRYYQLSLTHTAGEVIGTLCSEIQWFLHIFALPDGEMKADTLNAFLQHLSTSPYGGSVNDYVKFMDRTEASQKRPEGSNAVKIMTIHASKGLEFPYVYLVDCHRQFNDKDLNAKVLCDEDLGLCMKSVDEHERKLCANKLTIAARIKLKRALLEERMRLLYVALTRAKQGLEIFTTVEADDTLLTGDGTVNYPNAKSFADWLRPVIAAHGFTLHTVSDEVIDLTRPQDEPTAVTCDDGMIEKLDEYYTRASQLKICPTQKKSVTALMQDLSSDEQAPTYETGENDDRALVKGNAYHKAMELIDLTALFDGEWKKLSAREDIAAEVDKNKIATAQRIIGELTAGKKIYREQQFILSREEYGSKTLIQGVIDLLIVDGNEAIVVDYKTSKLSRIQSGEYKLQLATYAQAVRQILGLTVTDTYIYAFEADKLVKISL